MSYKASSSYKSFLKSKYRSIKYSTYFEIYDHIFNHYKKKKIKFVEIGVFDGGSLFMWRDFFGDQAEIVGIDLNPEAKKWEKYGFKIFIGDQSNPVFLKSIFDKLGKIDILLDDGGHTNEQQIVTTNVALNYIKNGGLLVIEDCHTSYMKRYGNPSSFSFMSYAKKNIDDINYRFFSKKNFNSIGYNRVFSMSFYNSIVVFSINDAKCKTSIFLNNNGITSDPKDFRYDKTLIEKISDFRLSIKIKAKKNKPIKICYLVLKPILLYLIYLLQKFSFLKLKYFFKK